MLSSTSRIFVAGHNGMVGSAIVRALRAAGYESVITASRGDVNLVSQSDTQAFFRDTAPDAVIIAAAKVGGIHANNTYPAQFIYENLMIECNCIHQAYVEGAERLLFLGSSCIYPKLTAQPMSEAALLTGSLEPTNEPYAIAKIAGIKLCESYNREYGCDFRSLMPTNLYGPGDNFHPENSHVIPALMRRIHELKEQSADHVVVWGTGQARREFLHVDDLAAACVFVLQLAPEVIASQTKAQLSHINVGHGSDVRIAELAQTICEVVGFTGDIRFDHTKPDGTPQKLLDTALITRLGWQPQIPLSQGLADTYHWFLNNQQTLRH